MMDIFEHPDTGQVEHLRGLNQVLDNSLDARLAYIAELEADIAELREAARPFSACVFNDNGDVSISTGNLTTQDWMRLDHAVAGAEAG
jgi:tRNA(Arg) A34 adenosine deaminase TadA